MLALGAGVTCAVAQYAPFPTIDSLDINNIHASVLVHGDMWWDPNDHTPYSYKYASPAARCYLAGTNKNVNFAGGLWMSGFDAGNSLHVTSQTYRQDGCDYWPGPLETSTPIDYASSQKWAKIWKVNGSDVTYFNSLSTHTTANTPPSILTWPGNGNVHAAGNGGASLTVTHEMAPFVDLNSNGIYEPLQGEYPDFKGDQALWYIFNDNGPTHRPPSATFLGVEIRAMSYGYNRGTLLDNVVYYDYTIVNRSTTDYHNMRIGLFDDADLGWYFDDFMGFDSSRRLGILYNGTNNDGQGGGHPVGSFGERPPMTGVTLVSIPGDTETDIVPAGGFVYYFNDLSTVGNPLSADTVIDGYLRGKTYGFWSVDSPFVMYNPYDVTGDPAYSDQISECSSNNIPGDRRFVLSTNDFDLPAGSSQHIVIAMVITDTGVGGCPNTSFARIREVSDTAWASYRNPPTSLHKNMLTTGPTEIKSWPNPARDRLFISVGDNGTISVYNAMGQVMDVPAVWNGVRYEVDISKLPKGLYNAVYRNGKAQGGHKFLKE